MIWTCYIKVISMQQVVTLDPHDGKIFALM